MDFNKLASDKSYRVEVLKDEITHHITPEMKKIKKREAEKPFIVAVPLGLCRMIKNFVYYDLYCFYFDKKRYNRYVMSCRLWRNI
jgi:hypothetical protein